MTLLKVMSITHLLHCYGTIRILWSCWWYRPFWYLTVLLEKCKFVKMAYTRKPYSKETMNYLL